jgi:hypothetical protein
MTTNRLWIIQTGGNVSTPWDDAISGTNTQLTPGLGNRIGPSPCKYRVSFFQKVDTRFILGRGHDSDFMLDKPYSPGEMCVLNFNLDDISSKLDPLMSRPTFPGGGLHKALLFGCILQGSMTNADIVKNSGFFSRQSNGKIYDINNNVEIEDENVNIIPWFFCHRAQDVPLYFIVVNTNSVQVISDLEGTYGENNTVIPIDEHNKGINNLIFNPKISRNGHLIGDQIVVGGDTLSITPFDNWFAERYPEFFKDANIKCHSNFKFERVGNTFNFELSDNVGYVHLRWDWLSEMHMTFLSSNSIFSKDFVVHKIKEYNHANN